KDAKVALEEIIKDASGSRDFGNARFVRKVIEAAGMAQSDRLLLKNTNPTVKEMCELTAEDFKNINLDQLRKSCKTIGFNSSK
ncbi:MAG: hypothetical protein MJ189_04295, partial [Coriobacteriales bacterium]|nr:hypothetical protein [Coriobacteriales bacterium]